MFSIYLDTIGIFNYNFANLDTNMITQSRQKEFFLTLPSLQVWYNVGHLSLGIGDVNLAYQVIE